LRAPTRRINVAGPIEEVRMAEHPNVELLRKGYEAFASGDMETVDALFADDISWHSPGSNPLAGDYAGKAQVLAMFAKLFEITEGTFRQEIHDIVANDEHGVVLVNASWDTPKAFSGRGVHVLHVKDGKVAEFWLYNEDQAAADAAFSG
jgi:uncharacterized protein